MDLVAPQVFNNFYTCYMKTFLFWAALFLSSAAIAQTFGTSFEEPELFNGLYTDTGDASIAHNLANNANEPLVNYLTSGGELGFNASYVPYDTPGTGLTDGDTVGVTDSPPNNGNPFPEGINGYEISDTDGNFILAFDPLELTSPTISIDYFISETGYEGDGTVNTSGSDRLRIYVKNLDDLSEYDLLNTTGNDINDLGIEGIWNTVSVSLENSLNSNVQLIIEARNNSAAEAFFFDNIIFEGVLGASNISKSGFTLYPNPARSFITILSQETGTISTKMYSILGEKIIDTVLLENKLDISNLRSGAYILKITQGNYVSTKKLIVRK